VPIEVERRDRQAGRPRTGCRTVGERRLTTCGEPAGILEPIGESGLFVAEPITCRLVARDRWPTSCDRGHRGL